MLNRLAMRICTVYALMGRTLAGQDVKDSDNAPIDPASPNDDTRPFIAVYTDDQTEEGVTLTIETSVSARMVEVDPETGEPRRDEHNQMRLAPGIPPTDAGIEAMIDIIERQIGIALDDEENAWGQLLKQLVTPLTKTQSFRGVMKTESGERLAGRNIAFLGKPINDPPFGQALPANGFWARFLTAVEAEPNLTQMAQPLRDLLTNGETVEGWRLVLRAMGMSREAGDALGVTPAFGMDEAPAIGDMPVEGGQGT